MNFHFVGNAKLKEQIEYLITGQRLPHAIILEGEDGLGKRTLAKEIAMILQCRSEGEKPCRQCAQCSKVSKNLHPDVYAYSPKGGPASFHVDTVREIREDAFIRPNEGNYKVYILGNCQCMNSSAQNAILKILEEPPAYAVFILTVNNKAALLETVLSRSVVLSVESVDHAAGAAYIQEAMPDVDEAQAMSAISVWGGNIGKAMESLGDGKLSKISAVSCALADALLANNEYDLLKACAVFDRDRETLIACVSFLKLMLRDALLRGTDSEMLSGQSELAARLASEIGKKKLMRLIDTCSDLIRYAERNANNAILITKVCYELRRALGR